MGTQSIANPSVPDAAATAAKSLTTVIYALYAATILVGITGIIAIIINYIKRDSVRGTIYESHFRWQIRTFWFSLLWAFLGCLTAFLVVGGLILAVAGVWWIYRIVKGWIWLSEGKPMYSAG